MNHEVLKRLIMDRALGEMAPDVEALLDDCLTNHPQMAEHAREINDTVMLAQQAMEPKCAVTLPPLKVSPLPVRSFDSSIPLRAAWPVGLAAAFILGLVLGVMVLRRPVPERGRPAVLASAAPNVATTETSFWSAQRWMNRESISPPPRPPRLSWTSPVQKPQLNDLP